MAGSTRINGFQDNTWINGIGDLFRINDGVKWGVNLNVYPEPESKKSGVSLSNAPILARKRLINQTTEQEPRGYNQHFTVADCTQWQKGVLGDCPALEYHLKQDVHQHCFIVPLENGITLYIPQFELARVLFFHNGYLARTALIHDALSNEFSVRAYSDEDTASINVLPTCTCPAELFNDYGYRRLMAWLLIDNDARYSYESIAMHQLRKGYPKGRYRIWRFQFDPPPLQGTELNVRGRYDRETQSMLVNEISSITNIPSELPDEIEFYSPKFYYQVTGKGKSQGSGSSRPPEHNVDDGSDESGENKPVMLDENPVHFEFEHAITTYKVSKKRKQAGRGKEDPTEPGEAPSDVSTEEQSPGGILPSAEWDNLDDQTDDAHLYTNKFTSYFEMLKLLQDEHGCHVRVFPLRKLPAIGKCQKHILETDGNPRCMSVAHVTVNGAEYYLLEVDTSDAKKALSTKVIMAKAVDDIEQHLYEIERRLLKASLSWPKGYLNNLFGAANHFWVAHQKSMKFGALIGLEIKKWAIRISERLNSQTK